MSRKPIKQNRICPICGASVTACGATYCSIKCKRKAERLRNDAKYAQPGGYSINPSTEIEKRNEHK